MTNEQINHLVAARNAITDRTEDYTNNAAVWHIDTVLRDVPQGQRPDVDKLLGRYADIATTLERHSETPPGWLVNPAVTLELDDIAEMCLRCDEQASEAPDYPGMWK